MPKYTQDNRPLRVDTVLPANDLLLDGFHGVEGVSMPFAFHVDLLSEKPDIDTRAMLRSPMALTFNLPGEDEETRSFHGLVRRFVQLGQSEDLTSYHAEVVPWLWFLSLSQECRIYQNLTPLEIIEQIFRDRGFADFDFRIKKPPSKREFVVQYRESHLNFVSRLLEEEGIFYFFEHSNNKHMLILADHNEAATGVVPPARFHRQGVEEEDVVLELEREHALHTGAVTLRDYDYLQPALTLENALSGEFPEEVYDYPGLYTKPEDGDRYVRIQLEAQEATHQTLRGVSGCRGFVSGHAFELSEHYRGDFNDSYLLLRVQHFMKGGDYRSGREAAHINYHNDFLAMPMATPFRPLRRTPKPMIHGTQTALVVGPSGEEVYTDKHARVKVQFYWDRVGQKNEQSSCWVRVATPWGGKGWGNITIPRIDNEVVVVFLEGDPDRPLVMGSVYNADQVPPFSLPDGGIQMGMKSRSSKGGGGYNEITLTDTKGNELITVHGQYDMNTRIEHDNTISIGNDESTTIEGNRTENVEGDETISIDGDRKENVGGNESIAISGKRTESVGGNEGVTIGGNRDLSVEGNETIQVTKDRTVAIGKKDTLTVSDLRDVKVSKDDKLQVGKKLMITAGDEIQIKTGSASITMKKDGTITIKGKDIKLNASGKIEAKASSTVTIKGSQIKQN